MAKAPNRERAPAPRRPVRPNPAGPVPIPPGLVDRAASIIRPVLGAVAADESLISPHLRTELGTARSLSEEAIAWIVADPYASEREIALDRMPQYSRDGFLRAERATVNLSDLAAAGLLPLGSCTVVPPEPGGNEPRGRTIARGARAALHHTAPPIRFDRDGSGAVTARARTGSADTLFGLVGTWAQPLIAPLAGVTAASDEPDEETRAHANQAFALLNPWDIVAPVDEPSRTLLTARTEFFARWSAAADLTAFWEGNHWRGRWAEVRDWAGADEAGDRRYWARLRWPGRRAEDPNNHLDPWLHNVLLLGAGTEYLDNRVVTRNLGRSLLIRLMGFREGNRAECAVCGGIEPFGSVHECAGLPRWERPPLFVDRYNIARPSANAHLREFARCGNRNKSAGQSVSMTAARPIDDTAGTPPGTGPLQPWPGATGPAGFWLTPTAGADSAARISFSAGAKVQSATVEVLAVCGTDRHPLARVRLTRSAGTALVPQLAAAPANGARAAVTIDADNRLVVPLLYHAALVAVTDRTGTGPVKTRVVYDGCGHLWEHHFPEQEWSRPPCPRCHEPAGATAVRLWVRPPPLGADLAQHPGAGALPDPVPAPAPAGDPGADPPRWSGHEAHPVEGDGDAVDVYVTLPTGATIGPRRMSRGEYENWLVAQVHDEPETTDAAPEPAGDDDA